MSVFLSNWDIQSINLWLSKMHHYKDTSKSQRANESDVILQLTYRKIGNGRHRIVFDLNNGYVLKVALTKKGIQCNETEFKIYNHCRADLRKHLCRVKEVGHGWIVMKKMENEVPVEISNKELIPLKNKFSDVGIKPRDMGNSNIRLSKKGKITVVDYGNFIMY
ncbi:hypothetical protein QU577_27120 [Priestia megaterium]|uniref:hypothetical protein n=1 Tax=Priestia megaterium TaxID=1404 RepID=UPI0025B0F8FE|nr:hypothetical protein [Priestia megaterium]MDN3365439.1 hypothetical protein [Priestia megaterium]